jgi:formylglycine-generating enzyme required for sulfatase activity
MRIAHAFVLVIAILPPLAVRAITIDTVPIGNANNAQDLQPNGLFGRVTSDYRIATTEVTNSQYVEFLNAVAASDPFALYNTNMSFYSRGGIARSGSPGSYTYSVKADVPGVGPGGTDYSYGDKPVVFVSFYDAIRFANWINNGATASASTETGAYTLANGVSVARNNGAVWFLPTENQWYKSAYYDGTAGTYYDYPTQTDTVPNNNLPSADTGNSANFYNGAFTQDESYPMTSVGAYTLSKSAYNTFDQAGNVWEWTETYVSSSMTRVRRGGAFDSDSTEISAAHRQTTSPTLEFDSLGFRLATTAVPGDYNANAVVDSADYLVWRKNLNQSVFLPNDTSPGLVSPVDYDVWRAHFGQTPTTATPAAAAGLSQSSVPEPASLPILLAFFIVGIIRYRLR